MHWRQPHDPPIARFGHHGALFRTAKSYRMKIPNGLQPLIDDGVIDQVLRPLKSGKEASVYVVRSGEHIRCAKVYKDMAQRSFQQRVQYQEGRKVRGSREARAMGKSTKFGRKEAEAAWKNAEVDALYLLSDAGVRVPRPYGYVNGVLLMELVTDPDGIVWEAFFTNGEATVYGDSPELSALSENAAADACCTPAMPASQSSAACCR